MIPGKKKRKGRNRRRSVMHKSSHLSATVEKGSSRKRVKRVNALEKKVLL